MIIVIGWRPPLRHIVYRYHGGHHSDDIDSCCKLNMLKKQIIEWIKNKVKKKRRKEMSELIFETK